MQNSLALFVPVLLHEMADSTRSWQFCHLLLQRQSLCSPTQHLHIRIDLQDRVQQYFYDVMEHIE